MNSVHEWCTTSYTFPVRGPTAPLKKFFFQGLKMKPKYSNHATTGHKHNSKIEFLAIKLPHKKNIKNNFLLETLGRGALIKGALKHIIGKIDHEQNSGEKFAL